MVNILVVDDEEQIRRLLDRTLLTSGINMIVDGVITGRVNY